MIASGATDLLSDGAHLLPALDRLGIAGTPLPWGEPVDPALFDGAVIRNTWDYVHDLRGFLGWCEQTAARLPLANPVDVLAWNSDKRYLRELSQAGVPTVPTVWVGPGEELVEPPWARFVVKPAVSVAATSTAAYDRTRMRQARRHVAGITAGGGVAMIQPYLASIDLEGEIGTYVIGQDVTHAIRRAGVLRTGAPPVADLSLVRRQPVTGWPVADEHARFARDVLRRVPGGPDRLLYARVDTVRGDGGELLLLEVECVAPYLFLKHSPGCAERVAAAFAAWLERHASDGVIRSRE